MPVRRLGLPAPTDSWPTQQHRPAERVPQARPQQHPEPPVRPIPLLHQQRHHLLLTLVRILRLQTTVRRLLVRPRDAVAHDGRALDRVRHRLHRRALHLLDVDPHGVAPGLQRSVHALDHALVVPVVRQHDVLDGATRHLFSIALTTRRLVSSLPAPREPALDFRAPSFRALRLRHHLRLNVHSQPFDVHADGRHLALHVDQ